MFTVLAQVHVHRAKYISHYCSHKFWNSELCQPQSNYDHDHRSLNQHHYVHWSIIPLPKWQENLNQNPSPWFGGSMVQECNGLKVNRNPEPGTSDQGWYPAAADDIRNQEAGNCTSDSLSSMQNIVTALVTCLLNCWLHDLWLVTLTMVLCWEFRVDCEINPTWFLMFLVYSMQFACYAFIHN